MSEGIVTGILMVTGVLTGSVMVGVAAPDALLRILLGTDPADKTMLVPARHWFLMIGLVGALLVFAAYDSDYRVPALLFAIIEKLALGAMVLTSPLRKRPLTVAVVCADATMAGLFIFILAGGVS